MVRSALFAMALGTALALVLAELALRMLGISYPIIYTSDACCGLALRPGATGWWRAEGRAWIAINSDGLRDVEHARAKDPQRFRIAVIGDSYAEAKQVSLEETFWSVAGRELERCAALPAPGVEMINFGVSGYSTAQELRLYETKAREYAPDLVVLAFHTGNDISDNSKELDVHAMRPYYELRNGELVLDDSFVRGRDFARRQKPTWQLASSFASHVRLAQLVNEWQVRRKQAGRKAQEQAKAKRAGIGNEVGQSTGIYLDPPSREWEEAWRVTGAILARFAREVAKDGADFFVISLSNGIQVNPDDAARRAFAEELGVPDLGHPERRLGAMLATHRIAYLALAPLLLEEAERSGACVHGFANAEPCAGHWNAEGHRAAGRILAGALCRRFAERDGSVQPGVTTQSSTRSISAR
jgi:hypothetical protein